MYAAVLLAGVFVFSAQVLVYAFVGHLYPPEIRGTALGMSAGVGRVGAIVGPSIGGALVTAGIAYPWGFYAFAVAAVLALLALSTVPAHMTRAGQRTCRTGQWSGQWKTGGVAGNLSSPGATVTSRALALVGAFDEEHRRLTLTELAAARPPAGADRAPAGRRAGGVGALARTSSGDYVIGRRLWDIGLLAPHRPGWSSSPRRTSTTCTAPRWPPCTSRCATAPRCSTSTGCAAHVGADREHGRLAGCRCTRPASARCCWPTRRPTFSAPCWPTCPAITAYTITQPGTLQRQLAAVLRDDYATTVEEMSLGACSVAVPIRRGPDVVAALGIVVPGLKRDKARLVSALQVAARGIGRAIA